MANRPSTYPFWTDSGVNVIQPPSELAETGYTPGQAPDAQNFNWLFGNYNDWIQYFDQLTATGIPISVIRLINGGTWSFNATTGALAWSADANLAIPSLSDASNDIPAGSVTLSDGQVAYTVANLPTYSLGDTSTTSNPNQITGMNYTGNVEVGYAVTGPGIPASTTVTAVGSNFVTISNNVTSNNSQATYTFAPTGALTVQVANNISLMPTINTILLARRSGNVIYLGVNCAQMVLRDGEFKTLIGSGYFSLYQAVAGQDLSSGTLVYISPGSADAGRVQGALYPLDVSAANQSLRGTYAGVIITDVTNGQTATVLYSGFSMGSGLMAGSNYYADPSNPGGITPTQPGSAGARIEPVAFAVTSTVLLYTGVAANQGAIGLPIFYEEDYTANGVQTVWTLQQTPLSSAGLFVYVNGLIRPSTQWSLSGETVTFTTAPAVGSTVEFKYVLASQTYIAASQETPTNPSGDNQTFQINTGVPINQPSTFVYVDGLIIPNTLWTLEIGGGAGYSKVVFNAALSPGQVPYITFFTTGALGAGAGGSGITGAANIGGGIGIYSSVAGNIIQLKTLVNGSNTTVVDNGNGTVQVNASASSSLDVHGSYASPITITDTVGVSPSTSMDQIWWITSAAIVSGSDPISANPQIAAGTSVGQRLTLFGITNGNGAYISINNGNGVLSNGRMDFVTGQGVVYHWNGSAWQFLSNAI